jgi:pSer/pThr/pTyr-binding forkhead associated (FHA) protein
MAWKRVGVTPGGLHVTRAEEFGLIDSQATLDGPPLTDPATPSLCLCVQSDVQSGLRIPCRRVVTLIGSRPGCKIHAGHALVAPVHCAIVQSGGQVIAVDLLTKAGTLLNGLKLENEVLNSGDTLAIEPYELRVEIQPKNHNGNGDIHGLDLEPSPQLIALEHVQSGRILQPQRQVCIMGRRPGADIHIDDPHVSRAHALLFVHYGYPVVFDLLSRNQTLVNGEPARYRQLNDNDVLRIGESEFRVRLVGSSVGQKKSKEAQVVIPPGTRPPVAQPAITLEEDLVDIHAVESTQRWRIADSLEKTAAKR